MCTSEFNTAQVVVEDSSIVMASSEPPHRAKMSAQAIRTEPIDAYKIVAAAA